MKKAQETNIKQLRDEVLNVTMQLRSGKITLDVAKTLFNGVGKAVSLGKAEMEYNKYAQIKRKIDFFETNGEEITK